MPRTPTHRRRTAPASARQALYLACGCACGLAALAQDAGNVTIDASRCLALASPEERLACFEAQVDAAIGDQGAPEPERASRPEPAPPAGEPIGPQPAARAPAEPPSTRAEVERAPEPARAGAPQPTTAPAPAPPAERASAPVPREPPAAAPAAERGRASRPASAPAAAVSVDIERAAPGQTDPEFGRRARGDRESEATELNATISALAERLPNQYMITLENGQVWRQTVPERYPLRAGQRVRIYPSRWGTAYRLAAEELGGFILVERVR